MRQGWDYMNIAPTPTEEPCTSVTRDGDYYPAMVRECSIFMRQLERMFKDREPEYGIEYRVKSFPHEFGRYCEVVVYYDATDEAATDFALLVEGNIPERWDEDALREFETRLAV